MPYRASWKSLKSYSYCHEGVGTWPFKMLQLLKRSLMRNPVILKVSYIKQCGPPAGALSQASEGPTASEAGPSWSRLLWALLGSQNHRLLSGEKTRAEVATLQGFQSAIRKSSQLPVVPTRMHWNLYSPQSLSWLVLTPF